MKLLDVKLYPDKNYRELFSVMIDNNTCEDTAVGITNDGNLLLVKSKLSNQSSAYWVDREIFSIDKAELREFFAQAKSNGYIEKAIHNRQTTEAELEKMVN